MWLQRDVSSLDEPFAQLHVQTSLCLSMRIFAGLEVANYTLMPPLTFAISCFGLRVLDDRPQPQYRGSLLSVLHSSETLECVIIKLCRSHRPHHLKIMCKMGSGKTQRENSADDNELFLRRSADGMATGQPNVRFGYCDLHARNRGSTRLGRKADQSIAILLSNPCGAR